MIESDGVIISSKASRKRTSAKWDYRTFFEIIMEEIC